MTAFTQGAQLWANTVLMWIGFGTVVGTLVLSIGVFRAQVGPRWVGPALWAFLLLEFVGSAWAPVFGCPAGLPAWRGLPLAAGSWPGRSFWPGTLAG